jgi:hypothetical protein
MMSAHRRYYPLVILLLLASLEVCAQNLGDLGMMGGSGIAVTPTTAVTPESHFRLDVTRMNLLRSGEKGMNSFGLTSGLSPNMEFTAKFQSVQAGTSLSPSFIGMGGKFVLPFLLPYDSRSAIWAEAVSTPDENTSSFIPSEIYRAVLVVQPSSLRKLNGNLLIGLTAAENTSRLALGCNASQAINGILKVGGELQYNYYGGNDLQESILVLVRAHPNVCIQLSPGYLHSSTLTSLMVSVGLSVSTSSIEFLPVDRSKDKPNEIPSFDELEKQIRGEKKNEN